MLVSAFDPLRTLAAGGSMGVMAPGPSRLAVKLWRGLKFILIDWTVTPRMLALNEQRPFAYQLVTTPIVTMALRLLVAVAIVIFSLPGV